MDAANLSLSRSLFLASLALLIPASAFSQTTFNLAGSGTNSTSVTLIGNQPSSVSVTSTASPATEIAYRASTVYSPDSNGVSWLCLNAGGVVNGSCDNVSGLVTPGAFNLQIGNQANSFLFTQTQHTATVTLTATDGSGATATITVNYTPGSNGTNTQGLVSVSQSAPSATVALGGSTIISLTLTSTSANPISFTLQTPPVSWVTSFITSGGLTQGAVSSSSPVTIQIGLSGAGLAQTTYSTPLFISYGNGSSLSITVTMGNGINVGSSGGTGTLQFSQTSIPWSFTTGTSNFPASAVVNVSSSAGGIGFTLATSPPASTAWFSVSDFGASTLPATLTITPNSNIGSLATGTYTGLVTVNGLDGSSQSVTINLTVNGGNASGLTVSPSPVTLQTGVNGSTVQQGVTVTSITGGNLTATVSGTGLSVSVSNSNVIANVSSTAITVMGNPAGLTNGTYIGSLTVTVGNVSQAVQVNLVVGTGGGTTGGGTGTITAAPSGLSFVYEMNSGMQISQQQQVYLAGSGNYTASVSTNNGGNWLSLSSTSGTLPTQFFQVIANASLLAAGTYNGSVTFTNSGTGQTSVVSVTLQVTGVTAVYTSPGDLVFNYIAGTTSASQSQSLSVNASDNSTVLVSASVTNPSSTPWLSISSNGSTSTGTAVYFVTINASSLANGVYTGSVTVSAPVSNSPITVPIVLTVVGSNVSTGGSGNLTLSNSSLTFQVATNGQSSTQQLQVTAATATSFSASTTTSNGNNTWLSVSPAGSSVTNATLNVTANPAGLNAGSYSGTVSLVSGSGTQTVNVTMIVGGGGSTGNSGNLSIAVNGGSATASPSLSFNATAVGQTVAGQFFSVSSAAGASGVGFTVAFATQSGGNWLQPSGITSGQSFTAPLTITVGVNTAGLASGTYNGSITLTPTGGTAVTVPVTLTIVGTPTISVTTTTLSFSYSAGAAAPTAQTIQVTGAGSGPAAFTASAVSTPAGWLSVTPASGTASSATPGSVSVSVNPAGLAAGTYTGTVTIAAGTGTTGTGTVTVTLTVTAPTVNINTVVNGASFLGGAVSPGEFVSLLGTSLGPLTPLGPSIDSTGKISTTLGNVQVLFNSTPAALTYVSSTQINCTVPYEVAGLSTVSVQVKYLGTGSNSLTLNVTGSAPGIFTATGTGTGQGAILNQNFTLNTAGNPAVKGQVIQIFMTGEGVTSPGGVDGAVTPNSTTVPVLPIAVKIGGQPASVVFEGEAPGIVAGVLQLNVLVPTTVSSGANQLVVTIGSNSSQANLTVAVQ